ncbi:MAG: rhodanese-like domain-containing protein [Planctomycetes bacterium]|nr:rhodanese-like domain-containing protein [Planctomycetota bacterium]
MFILFWYAKSYIKISPAAHITPETITPEICEQSLWVDVRSIKERKMHDIPGSIHHSLEEMAQFQEDQLKDIVLFCNSGIRASKAANELKAKGYMNAQFFVGTHHEVKALLDKKGHHDNPA